MNNATSRFWNKVRKTDTCWLWSGYIKNSGYAQFTVNSKNVYVHRFSYELHKGIIPKGLEIDHLCSVRNCVNPEHLEAVNHKTNSSRARNAMREKSTCKNGHQFTEENTYLYQGHRHCKKCKEENYARYCRLHREEKNAYLREWRRSRALVVI